MKKSEIYYLLQLIVLGTRKVEEIDPEHRLEMLNVLMSDESSAKTYEAYLAREAEKEAQA